MKPSDETPLKNIDDYLVMLPVETREALEKLRGIIRAAAPEAEEVISYQMPAFKYKGSLVGFAAFKNHCSFFPMNSKTVEAFKNELKAYKTSKGTIQFTLEKPLPAALVKKIVKARIKENEEIALAKKNKSKK